ncbi:MAG: acyl-CoA thioesterase [Candidatus Cryptobacteroides sp.]
MALSETIRIRVRFSEVDSIKMVWHGNYVKYLEDAREAFGRKYGLEYMTIYRNGFLAPMYEMHMKYVKSATIDDILCIKIVWKEVIGAKLVFDYEIRRESDGELVLTAESVQLFTSNEGELQLLCPPFYEEWKRRWSAEISKAD